MNDIRVEKIALMSGIGTDNHTTEHINNVIREGWVLFNTAIISESSGCSNGQVVAAMTSYDLEQVLSRSHYMICTFVRTKASQTLYGNTI